LNAKAVKSRHPPDFDISHVLFQEENSGKLVQIVGEVGFKARYAFNIA
jgi:hypothetical protein